MIDNIQIIKPLLTFESEDDFYYLQILQRKKENDKQGSNSRVIKNYYIGSFEYLEDKYEEIKKLCDVFNARAYIRLNKRSYYKIAFKALVNLSNTIMNKEFILCRRSYDRAVGQSSNESSDKRWIIDIDEKDENLVQRIKNKLVLMDPEGPKYKCTIPSKNGYHIITNPFNLQQFSVYNFNVEIHKDNPTNLYIPFVNL